ncbi:MAG: hypothetical protein ACI4S4_00510 [Candidatus Ornithospirochaeta sp.]
MKKTIAIALIICLITFSISAYTDSLLQFDTPLWLELDESVKCNKDPETVSECYSSYTEGDITVFERARAEYVLCRYYSDRGDYEKAMEHMEKQKETLSTSSIESEVLSLIAEMDLSSSKTCVEKDLSSGLENSNLTKKAFKEYPEEVYIAVVNAWRLIYTPQIAGGSNKNAIKNLEPMIADIGSYSVGNQYSIYGALAMAHYNRKDYKEAKEYLSMAFEIYDGEPTLLDLGEKLEKKLK